MSQTSKSQSPGMCIYQAPEQMVRLIKIIKRLSISTTILSAGVQPFLFPKLLATGSSFAIGFASITCAGIFVSPLILNLITRRYVTKLFYDDRSEKFTAKHLNLINRDVMLSYQSKDVRVPEMLGIFTTYTVGPKRRPLFIDPQQVTDMDAYKKMLGFDLPIDFKADRIYQDSKQIEKKS